MSVDAATIKGWPEPEFLAVPLEGAAVISGIKKGRPVGRGKLLARHPNPELGDVHSPINGVIESLNEYEIFVRRTEEGDAESPDPVDLAGLAGEALAAALKSLGLGVPAARPSGPIILSAFDPEPEISHTRLLFREHRESLAAGAELLRRLFPESEFIWAAPENFDPPADFRVVAVRGDYPWTLPPLVEQAVLHRLGGVGAREASASFRVNGGITKISGRELFFYGRAARAGWPLTHTPVTLQGAEYFVPVGARIRDLLDFAHLTPGPGDLVVVGGLWRGRATARLTRGLKKRDLAVHLAHGAAPVWPPRPCRRCRACSGACPLNLPLGRFSALEFEEWLKPGPAGRIAAALQKNCVRCGLCAAACPERRPLLAMLEHAFEARP